MIGMYIVTAILIFAGVSLIRGHGLWMIAGYNTLSSEEKKKWDERKLGRVTGNTIIAVAITLFIGIAFKTSEVTYGVMLICIAIELIIHFILTFRCMK